MHSLDIVRGKHGLQLAGVVYVHQRPNLSRNELRGKHHTTHTATHNVGVGRVANRSPPRLQFRPEDMIVIAREPKTWAVHQALEIKLP